MPRRRYYRRYTRVVAPKKKWASNLITVDLSSSSTSSEVQELVKNSAGTSTPTPIIVKTGNFKIQGDCGLSSTSATLGGTFVTLFLVFVPEGWSDVTDIPLNHPEWVMGWTSIDFSLASASSPSAGNKFSLTSRLKRNLNSGDKIVLYLDSRGAGSSITATVKGYAQYFTCAN